MTLVLKILAALSLDVYILTFQDNVFPRINVQKLLVMKKKDAYILILRIAATMMINVTNLLVILMLVVHTLLFAAMIMTLVL